MSHPRIRTMFQSPRTEIIMNRVSTFRMALSVGFYAWMAAALLAVPVMARDADVVRPGDVKPATAEKAPPSPNWVFGTQTGDPFYDHFEGYDLGEICGQTGPPGVGEWEEWDGTVYVCGHVIADILCPDGSANQSLEIVGSEGLGGDDMIHRFEIVGGVWTVRADVFVANDATGSACFALLADYWPHGGMNWALQIRIDADLDVVESEWGTSFSTPLIRGRWVELRIEIDFPADVADYYYDGAAFDTGQSWTNRVGRPNRKSLRAINLYGNQPPGGTTGTIFDNVCVRRPFDPPCTDCPNGPVCVPCDMNCDGTVDANDIEDFIDCLFYICEPCNTCTGDVNGDGRIDAGDVEGFIECLFP